MLGRLLQVVARSGGLVQRERQHGGKWRHRQRRGDTEGGQRAGMREAEAREQHRGSAQGETTHLQRDVGVKHLAGEDTTLSFC